MGTDQLVLLEDEAFADGDSYSTASALAAAIKKIGDYELILCGREAADTNAGQVGPAIAEMLGRPGITLVKKIAVSQGKAKVERVTDDGYEVIEVALPALLTVSHEIGEPRYPTIKRSLMAKKIEPTVWTPADIGLAAAHVGAAGRRSEIVRLFQPVRDVKCEIIDGESAEEAGANLALRLREAKLI
jgi:electron transfer flavoprotein beta subunit